MIVSATPSHNRFLTDTDWEGYLKFLDAVGDRRIRVTYDGTMLELMTPSNRHEVLKSVLGSLLECLMQDWAIDFIPGGQTTFQSVLKRKGLEPDECYFIASWRQVLGGWKPEVGPPPDLVIEVEVSRSALDRLEILAALGVPELWRVDEEGGVSVWLLRDGAYQASVSSPNFAGLPLSLMSDYLAMVNETSTMRLIESFRQAVRELPRPQ